MAEFQPITTQEQLERVIGNRIKQVRENAEKQAEEKYSDYTALQQQNEQYANQIAQLTEQIKKQTETLDGNKATVDDLNAKIHQYETASVKTKVALELGLPYQMASRLAGDDEEAIRADAEAMVQLIGTQKPVAPLGSGEAINKDNPSASAWGALATNLTNKN